ncbi:MAG: L-histidine N(alpha)-methyltransferase [Aureliella sp.]
MNEQREDTHIHCQTPSTAQFLRDAIEGLSKPQKKLPSKYLYDQAGSALFDQICELDEYYLTRTEAAIMRQSASQIAGEIGGDAVIVELGSGSSTKTRILLDALDEPQAYLAVDISEEHLLQAAEGIRCEYPDLVVEPVIADFTHAFRIPAQYAGTSVHVFFPGSTIGNLDNDEALELLQCASGLETTDGTALHPGLLIGFDLVKDTGTLEAAYNDAAGVSAKFTLNMLHRMNRELEADFRVDAFEHYAYFNVEHSRIEIYIRSLEDQTATIDSQRFEFAAGELILTEYSHKYTLESLTKLAQQAGFHVQKTWTDDQQLFALMLLECDV